MLGTACIRLTGTISARVRSKSVLNRSTESVRVEVQTPMYNAHRHVASKTALAEKLALHSMRLTCVASRHAPN